MNFKDFSEKVNEQFNRMAVTNTLLHSNASKEAIWNTYIDSFPEESNPIYLTNSTHDCTCCKSFLRQVGNVVTIKDNEIITLWDNYADFEYPYNVVAKALYELVLHARISRVFKPSEKKYGEKITHTVDSPEKPRSFNHFYCTVSEQYWQNNHTLLDGYQNNFIPSLKSFQEITVDSVETVLNLIKSSNLARGEEHLHAIISFREWQILASKANNLDLFVWEHISQHNMAIRNTVIGSLLKDLSKGKQLDHAVASYEKKVSGDNYKRPKALITSGMIKKATEEINKRGLEPSLYRRHARHSDMNVNDILFVDKTIEKDLIGGILSELEPQKTNKTKQKSMPEDINITEFIHNVLPNTTSLQIGIENKHLPNFVNIFAAVNAEAPKLFKWDNQFSWGYNGDVADSVIKRNVSKAGGDVTGDFRASFGWHDSDDLDISLITPNGRVYFQQMYINNFVLDVDMNASSSGHSFDSREPVENITRPTFNNMKQGTYHIEVHNYQKRSNSGKGFTIELEVLGEVFEFTYPKQLNDGERLRCISLFYDGNEMQITTVNKMLSTVGQVQKIWNLNTNDFYQVNLVTLSPNYWGEDTGNRHYMFIIENCLNPDRSRAIYNEFLMEELTPIRKTFEVLGSKALVDYSSDQLAGLGFSSTKRSSVIVLADGRPYNILF